MDWSFLIRNRDSITVTTDSRKVTPGSVFVALKGEHFDGNDYVEQAKASGAEYVISGPNALLELQDLAREWRRYLGIPIIAITGTNGKTTTKELTAAVLSTNYNLWYTQGNLNNAIGVPLTLLSISRAHELAIVEMGASHPGDIKELVDIAEPNYGLITNVGKAHLAGFGSFEGVQKTKAELYDYLAAHPDTSKGVFINEQNPLLVAMLTTAYNKPLSLTSAYTYTPVELPKGSHLIGTYNAENVGAAIAIGEAFGISRKTAYHAIRDYIPSNNRSQFIQTAHNQVVADCYNANPTSMQAAINAFDGDCYILGEMGELGDYAHTEHQNIVNMLAERKAESVFLVGNEFNRTTTTYPIYDNVDCLKDDLIKHPITSKKILVKGSRTNRLEKILEVL